MLPDDNENNLENDFNATNDINKGVKKNEVYSPEDIDNKDRQNAYFLRESLIKLLKNLLESEWIFFFLESTIGFSCFCIIAIAAMATYYLICDSTRLFNTLNSAIFLALIGLSGAFLSSKFSKK